MAQFQHERRCVRVATESIRLVAEHVESDKGAAICWEALRDVLHSKGFGHARIWQSDIVGIPASSVCWMILPACVIVVLVVLTLCHSRSQRHW